jgi:hydrogenase-1 operon protein HyaF
MVGLGDDVKQAVSRVLGEGEVSAQIGGESVWHVQESVFTGVWRCCQYNGASTLVADWLEAARLPRIVLAAARATPPPGLAPARMPLELKGAPGLIREIRSRAAAYRPGIRAHVFNLTLAPMGAEDYFALEQAFPAGRVAITSLGFGNCRIMSTAARDVWRVQYFNNVNALILDTIEVVGVPELALASADDLVDSRSRLAELIAWMTESNGERVAV